MADRNERPLILTGAKPSGEMTLGNYLGAIKNWAAMQESADCLFPIMDLHAITERYVPAELRKQTLSFVAQYIACGLDPERSKIFIQSQVSGHTELSWILATLCPVGELQRMTQFKEKSSKPGASVNAGLLFYPILMAADILLYNADLVPVGDDQKQHLEMARNLAQRFNSTYSETFTVPKPYIAETGARIMSLQDPASKMSKSDKNPSGCILLLDPPNVMRKKILSAVTDSGSEVRASDEKPGITNLLNILSSVTDRPISELETEFSSSGYGDFKKAVAEAVVEKLEPVQNRYQELMKNRDYLVEILKTGSEDAQYRADRMMRKVNRKAGFLQKN